MRTIGFKKLGLSFTYLFILVAGAFFTYYGFNHENKIYILVGFIGIYLIIYSLIVLFRYIFTPYKLVTIDENNHVVLPKGVTISPKDVVDVSYNRAHARYGLYKYGEIVIKTTTQSYKVRYVAECEKVAKQLTQLMYTNKL